MKLKNVRLRNICQHRDTKVEFCDGLNAVLGPNGSGKSNLLNSVYAAATNDFSRFTGPKIDQISQFAQDNEKSFIDLTFEHGSNVFNIYRGLEPTNKYLTVNDGTKITNERDIASTLESMLGVSSKIMSDYVFVDQWQLFAFLLQTDSDRAKAMQRLFGIDKAEACWEIVGKFIPKISIPRSIIDEDSVRQRLKANKLKVSELADTKSKLEYTMHYTGDIEQLSIIIEDYKKRKEIEKETSAILAKLTKLTNDREVYDIEAEENLATEIAAMSDELAVRKDEFEKCRTALKDYKAYNDIVTKRKQLEKSLAEVIVKLQEKPLNWNDWNDDFVYIEEKDTEVKQKELTEINSTIQTYYNFIDNFNDGGTLCPTCGEKVSNVKKKCKDYLAKVGQLETAGIQLNTYLIESKKFRDKERQREERRAFNLDKKFDLEVQLDDLNKLAPPSADEKTLTACVECYDALVDDLKQANREYDDIQKIIARLDGQINQLTDSMNINNAELELLDVTEEDAKLAATESAFLKKLQIDIFEVSATLNATNSLIQNDVDALKEVVRIKTEAATTAEFVQLLEDMRNIMHRESLPKLVAQNYLEELLSNINDVLDSFDSPFRVENTDNLSFRALFNDGRNVRAEALSGGEKALFAIAFRIVINSTFAKDIGLLCLDEPTAGLDEKNIGCLTIAMERLRQLSKSTGLQCVLITHEKSLMSHFDKVIEL